MKLSEIFKWKRVKESDYSLLVTEIKNKMQGFSTIFLEGEVGAGKTTFTRHFCEKANSPTYSIVDEYEDIVHADFYRLNSKEDIMDLCLEDYFEGKNFFLAEWGEQYFDEICRYLPFESEIFLLKFDLIEENSRDLSFHRVLL